MKLSKPVCLTFLLIVSVIQSVSAAEALPYQVFRGVSHVHTRFSHDSEAMLPLVMKEARMLNFDFVIITDHNSMKGREGFARFHHPGHALMIFGEEISAPDGHMIALGTESEAPFDTSSQDLIDWIHAHGGYVFLPHPFSRSNPWKNWSVNGWDGMELYNYGHELFNANPVDMYLNSFTENERQLLAEAQAINPDHFPQWDKELEKRMVAGIAGVDAHLKRSEKWFSLAMSSVTLYVLASELTEKEVIRAVGTGRAYSVFELHGHADGFSFSALTEGGTFTLGDEVVSPQGADLHVHLPASASIRLIHHGSAVSVVDGTDLDFHASEAGAYRVEVFKDEKLWIFTNPIYLKTA